MSRFVSTATRLRRARPIRGARRPCRSARPKDKEADTLSCSPGRASAAMPREVKASPSMAVRCWESRSAAVASLTTRVDGLVAASQAFQSTISDRLVAYVESTSVATTAQNDALDEYRRATERTVTELRHATRATDKLLRTLGGRLEEVST